MNHKLNTLCPLEPLWMGGFNGLMVDDISEPAVISGVHFACDQQSQPQRRNCETQPLGEKGLSYAESFLAEGASGVPFSGALELTADYRNSDSEGIERS
jgi:hypothetical protein